jgi:fibronectin-binding autotransporter adhesin
LTAHSIGGGSGANGGSSKFYFNGGILKPTVNDEDVALALAGMAGQGEPAQTLFMQYLTQVVVQEGGAIIDTDGNSITIAQNLEHGGALAKDGGLTKLGEGTLILSGINTYTGDTIVSEGTLRLAETAGLKFVIGASGVNNWITGTGTLQLDGNCNFDLDAAGVTLGDTWTIVDNDNLAETFSDTFTVVGFTDMGGDKWSLTISGTKIYEFSEATGILRVKPFLPGDTNEDGVVDAIDYIALKTHFGMTEGATLAQGDLDENGTVDWADLQILMDNFGTRSIGGAPAIPEPATLGLLAIGALAILRRRRRS